MRDPTTPVDLKTEAAIKHAVERLRRFVGNGRRWPPDPPWEQELKALKSLDDGKRRTLDEWIKLGEGIEVHRPRGHPSYWFVRRQVILLVLDEITALGFRRRRNQANYDDSNKPASGCSIISIALRRLGSGMSEAAVVDLTRPSRRKARR
jgi:hypothetical protein